MLIPDNFTAKQRQYIEWAATSKFDRDVPTQKALAESIGVTEVTICRWKYKPEIQEAIQQRSRDMLKEALPEVRAALKREAEKGNFQHIKLILEVVGEHVDSSNVNHKVEVKPDLSGVDSEDLKKARELLYPDS